MPTPAAARPRPQRPSVAATVERKNVHGPGELRVPPTAQPACSDKRCGGAADHHDCCPELYGVSRRTIGWLRRVQATRTKVFSRGPVF